jgi:hypothetical protein
LARWPRSFAILLQKPLNKPAEGSKSPIGTRGFFEETGRCKQRNNLKHRVNLKAFLYVALIFLCGCAGSNYLYSPKEEMVVLKSHNSFMELGPCGGPWNYDDQVSIFLPANAVRCDASQLEAYQHGKLKIDSGYIVLNRTNKTVAIELTFEGYDGERVPVKCKYNGVHRYVEWEPQSNEVTRDWLKNFYRTNGTSFYER